MDSAAYAEDRRAERQAYSSSDNPSSAGNALKHGLRSAAVLLPDDDGSEFGCLRRDLFHTYRPRTGDEAACVEAMAAHHWRMARCRRWQAVYDAQTDALLTGDPNDLAGHICEPDPHRWMHRSMDCTLQESRLDRLLCRARDKLLLLQKLRRNHVIPGALEPEPKDPWIEPAPAEANRSALGSGPVGKGPEFRHPADASHGRTEPGSPSADWHFEKSDERTAATSAADRAPPSRMSGPEGVTAPSSPGTPAGAVSVSPAREAGRASGQGESRAAEGVAWGGQQGGDAGSRFSSPARVQPGEADSPTPAAVP